MDDGYIHGINKMKKPATKVMAPPGGQSQINVFSQSEAAAPSPINICQAKRNESSIVFGGPEPLQSSGSNTPVSKQVPSANTNITGVKNNSEARTSTKVMAPPGGRSSINLFGP